jgi:hypothetical protein
MYSPSDVRSTHWKIFIFFRHSLLILHFQCNAAGIRQFFPTFRLHLNLTKTVSCNKEAILLSLRGCA